MPAIGDVSRLDALLVGGVPVPGVFGSQNSKYVTPGGKVLYVGNLLGGPYGDGTQATNPIPTLFGLGGALARLSNRQNRGDIIYVLPGHAENVSVADSANAVGTAAGFSVIGLGVGPQRGTFTWTTAASTWLLNTANVEIANLNLTFAVTAATTVVAPMTVSATGCRIVDCFINWGVSPTIGCGSTLGAISVTGTFFDCLNNTCQNSDIAGTLALTFLALNGANNCRIKNNKILGSSTITTVGTINFLGTLSSNVEISGNYIENLIAASTIALSSAVLGVTGVVSDNTFRIQATGISPCTVSTNLSVTFKQNWCNNTANRNAALVVGAATSI